MTQEPSRAWLARLLVAAAGFGLGSALAQKIDDVPPAVQNNVAPNFMFMVDTSGSMSNIVPAAPYSATASYLASCPSSSTVPAGTSVDLRVAGGAPRFFFNGSTFRHTTVAAAGVPARCFNNGAMYGARLLADGSVGGVRQPASGYLDAEYSGHFLNWYFGNFSGPVTGWTDRKLVTAGAVESRIEIARRSARQAIDALPLGVAGRPQVRVGLSHYRTGGGRLRVAMADLDAAHRTSVKDAIEGLTPAGSTPLATTLADIGRYMATGYNGPVDTARANGVGIDELFAIRGADNAARRACLADAPVACDAGSVAAAQKPIQYWCQRTSIFAMTDGRPQNDRGFDNNPHVFDYDGDCSGVNRANCTVGGSLLPHDRKNNRTYESAGSDYMDDVAKLLFDVDLRPDLAKPMPVAPAPRAKNNISTYMIGFADTTVQNDPLLASTARQGGGRFIAATDGPTLLDAFQSVISDALARDAAAAAVSVTNAQITAGTVGYASSYNSGSWFGDLEAYSLDITTGLQNGPVQWSARDRLNAQGAANRRIASFDGSRGVAFTAANGPAFRSNAPTLSDALIAYTRGDRTGEGSTFRARAHLLGDIINAEPVVVNYPAGAVVYQAANDGMLHAFDGRIEASVATRGQELWAYVPRLVHGKLADRANPIFQHEFLVDGTPTAADIAGAGGITRVLVGGLAKGGAGFYGLDISSGTAASESAAAGKVLWESRPANMGYSFGLPLVVNTAAGWRVAVTSGYRNDGAPGGLGGDGRGRVWLLHPATGAVEKEFVTPAGFGNASASLGLAFLAKPSNLGPTSVVRHVYGGDLQGNVWRFDLNAASGSNPVRIAVLRDASGNLQPVSSPPVVAPVPGSATQLFVYVGTGQYFSLDDVPGTATPNASASQVQTIYGIVDDTGVASPALPAIRNTGAGCPANGGTGDFACQAAAQNADGSFTVSHNTVDLTRKRGFYLDIPMAGGRVNTQPALSAGGTLVVVVNVPSNLVCNPGGNSFLFQLSGLTGGAVLKNLGGSDYYAAVYTLGAALSSRAVIVRTSGGQRALTRGSDKTTGSTPIVETGPCVGAGCSAGPPFRRIYIRPLN